MLISDMRNMSTLINKMDHRTRLNTISITVCGWICLKFLKHPSYKNASTE